MLQLQFSNYQFECGTDEAGRGCLAGPVTAAAVILKKDFKSKLITDSKKLSKNQREEAKNLIIENKNNSVDSILVVDIPGELKIKDYGIENENINTISLISPTTKVERIESIANNSSGFIYYVTLRGVTGSSNLNSEEIIKNIDTIKKYAKVPTLAGFGIKSEEDAKLLSKHSDGVIIGSSIVKMIEDNSKTKEFAKIGDYLVSMKKAIT